MKCAECKGEAEVILVDVDKLVPLCAEHFNMCLTMFGDFNLEYVNVDDIDSLIEKVNAKLEWYKTMLNRCTKTLQDCKKNKRKWMSMLEQLVSQMKKEDDS